jgi:hypothetical protein
MEECTPDGSKSPLRKEGCGGEACATAYYVQHASGIKNEDLVAEIHVKLNMVAWDRTVRAAGCWTKTPAYLAIATDIIDFLTRCRLHVFRTFFLEKRMKIGF